MHIAIAGNIGAGKTTLTKLLAKHYKWKPHYEAVDENPYLDDFYAEMERWSFNLQVFFLNSRFRQILELRESGKDIIQDRTIYEDAHIFARIKRIWERYYSRQNNLRRCSYFCPQFTCNGAHDK